MTELASKDEFFACAGDKPLCVPFELPTGKVLFVEEVSHLESETVTADLVKRRRQVVGPYDTQAKARFIVQCCTDGGPNGKGGGKPFFTVDDIPRLMSHKEKIVAPLYYLCELVNGQDAESIMAFKKKYVVALARSCGLLSDSETQTGGGSQEASAPGS